MKAKHILLVLIFACSFMLFGCDALEVDSTPIDEQTRELLISKYSETFSVGVEDVKLVKYFGKAEGKQYLYFEADDGTEGTFLEHHNVGIFDLLYPSFGQLLSWNGEHFGAVGYQKRTGENIDVPLGIALSANSYFFDAYNGTEAIEYHENWSEENSGFASNNAPKIATVFRSSAELREYVEQTNKALEANIYSSPISIPEKYDDEFFKTHDLVYISYYKSYFNGHYKVTGCSINNDTLFVCAENISNLNYGLDAEYNHRIYVEVPKEELAGITEVVYIEN